MEISEYAYNEMVSVLTSGLSIDGSQHKQYYLDKALLLLVGRKQHADIKEREDWENGLPA